MNRIAYKNELMKKYVDIARSIHSIFKILLPNTNEKEKENMKHIKQYASRYLAFGYVFILFLTVACSSLLLHLL